ncbi:hypothetical protein Lepto7375DRAFT_0507 [Leptolyngbya sp. PCC 7375]|nr:hypothetical protein Lepto7375DRAFT_0507 [Leptolyngbya sp. PCC 7375]
MIADVNVKVLVAAYLSRWADYRLLLKPFAMGIYE